MAKSKRKECLYYIVLQNGPLTNGRCKAVVNRYHVGANSEKEALALCKEKVDSKSSFHVYYRSSDKTLPRRTVIEAKGTHEPYHEIDGMMYLETDEYRARNGVDEDQTAIVAIERKFVKRYARGAKDVSWRPYNCYVGAKQIAQYYQLVKTNDLPPIENSF